ncbi:hypothetical protein [Pseudoalteromonas sp. ZZD1]|uniref:hypothetical protein n=1 Tax=Pseudoalteromonas sp. ZZD1 TaxID=3139395 RepID=UPI003BAD8DAA
MIESHLLKIGGMLSTELKTHVMSTVKVSSDTARKRIQREEKNNPNVCKLLGLSFRNGSVFYYHKNHFGSTLYWRALYKAFIDSKSAYSYAVAALLARDKIMPSEIFPIHCGIPARMAKNLSYERVLTDLKAVNAIREYFIPKVGDCISLMQQDEYLKFEGEKIKACLLAEEVLISSLGSWLKKLNIASFKKVAFNRSEKSQLVNGFYWDISAPSYLTPLISIDDKGQKPGFVVCDVMLNVKVDDIAISPFLNKVRKSQFSKKQGRCIYIFVAEEYTEGAFDLAKKAGVIPATTRNLFGRDVEEALKSVISVFSHLASFIDRPEQINDLFKRLNKIEGAVGNLRGTLFEFIVAESLRAIYPRVELGIKLKSTINDKKYDADIMITKPDETLIIECKSGHAGAVLAHEQVVHWLQEQVPNMYKTLAQSDNQQERKYSFELWSTKELRVESIQLIQRVSSDLKKYSVSFKTCNDVRQEINKSNQKGLLDLLDQHYLKHPLNKL